jgi:hypothetical protein
MTWVEKMMKTKWETIAPEDFDIINFVDTAEEAFKIIKKSKERPYF